MIKAGVIGNPISHSKSPRLHNHWLSILGLSAEYHRICAEKDGLSVKIDELNSFGYAGCNVTLPFKEEARLLAQTTSNFVEYNGAANTLVFSNGQIEAHNTDGYGFSRNILQACPDWNPRGDHLVLGAGGAAKAIVTWLVRADANSILVVNRNLERAEALRSLGSQIEVASWQDLSKFLTSKDSLINTTSMGMNGLNDIEIDFSNASNRMVVNDIVYTPLETGLIKNAKSAGLRTVDGLGMLLWQARPGFEAWFGKEPPMIDKGLRNFMVSDQVIAITGSIGMGKSTVLQMFREFGFATWEADAEVSKLYEGNDELYSFIERHEPTALEGDFDKSIWRNYVFNHPEVFPELEDIIHRNISHSRREFLESEANLKICDIPLLFEVGNRHLFDKVVTVSAPRETQLQRVLARGTMNESQLDEILNRQMSDENKKKRADFVIDNRGDLFSTREQVCGILDSLGVSHA